jgi:threonine dehydratase
VRHRSGEQLARRIASAAKHVRPKVRIFGVQAERAPAYLSWKQGVAVNTDICDTIADGLATRTPVPENVVAIRELVDDLRLGTEAQMLRAIEHLHCDGAHRGRARRCSCDSCLGGGFQL